MTVSGRFIFVASLFTTCLVSANIMAVKLTAVHGHVLDAGIVIFPISYILGDVLTEVWGFRAARRVIWTAFLCNLIVVGAIQIAIHLPNAGFGVSNPASSTVRSRDSSRCQLWRAVPAALASVRGRCESVTSLARSAAPNTVVFTSTLKSTGLRLSGSHSVAHCVASAKNAGCVWIV